MLIRTYGLVASLSALVYGLLVICAGDGAPDGTSSRLACGAWLCPLEFSPAKVFDLEQKSHFPATREQAIKELTRALNANAASAYRWADLGEAFLSTGRPQAASECMGQAVLQAPNSPAILIRAANVAMATRNYSNAVGYASHVLEDREAMEFYPAVFLLYSRLNLGAADALSHGVRENQLASEIFLRSEIALQRADEAQLVWSSITAHHFEKDDLTGQYLRFLISRRQEEAAADAWRKLNASVEPDYRKATWAFDGGFERAPENLVPFDWQTESDDDVEVGRTSEPRQGKWSLTLTFAGLRNVQFEGVHQEAVLSPGKWCVQAWMRAESLTTDQGLCVRVVDARDSRRLDVRTDALTGSHDWTKVERLFEVPKGTSLVRVELFRESSSLFDNKIVGRAWVDDVQLSPAR